MLGAQGPSPNVVARLSFIHGRWAQAILRDMSAAGASTVSPEAAETLRRLWGADAFRPGQAEVVAAVLAGRDALAVMPTGGGKSVLYQLPAAMRPGVTLVISPLIALMDDQVAGLARRGLRAAALHAGRPAREIDQALTDARFGKYRLLYLTPERLLSEGFIARMADLPITLLAVDEAHCISEWGHDFRPAYRRIAEARPALRGAPVLAVTATATPEVRRDILELLALNDPELVVRGFDRPNLVWTVQRVDDRARRVGEIIAAVPGSGIVYAGTRRGTESWAATLRRAGIGCEAYHAGMPPGARASVQARWIDGRTRYLAATSAFGMGVDKPDVRAVIHVAMPSSVEAYYQEAGRAGRDGRRAHAVLLVRAGDERLPRALAEEGHPDYDTVQRVYTSASSLARIAIGSLPDGPTTVDLEALERLAATSPLATRASLAVLARAGAWALPARDARTAAVRIADVEALRAWGTAGAGRGRRFALDLLRALPGETHGAWGEVRLAPVARRLGLPEEKLAAGLRFLADRELLEHRAGGVGQRIDWVVPRSERPPVSRRELDAARRRPLARLAHVLRYVDGVGCRRRHLLAYFGEPAPARCGRCDVCLGRHRPRVVTPADEALLRDILSDVEAGAARDSWLTGRAAPRERDALADWLLNEGLIRLEDPLADRYALSPKGMRLLRGSERR